MCEPVFFVERLLFHCLQMLRKRRVTTFIAIIHATCQGHIYVANEYPTTFLRTMLVVSQNLGFLAKLS